ncbi:MAG: hypothetical protein Q9190_003793 [Brigantiaea leucoxantha]
MPRAAPAPPTQYHEDDFEEDDEGEGPYYSDHQSRPSRNSRPARRAGYTAPPGDDLEDEAEDVPGRASRSKKSVQKSQRRRDEQDDDEDEESEDDRRLALVPAKSSKAVARRKRSPEPKKKQKQKQKQREEEVDSDSSEEMIKVRKFEVLELTQIKPEFLNLLGRIFSVSPEKVAKWCKKGWIRVNKQKNEYDVKLLLKNDVSARDVKKWNKEYDKMANSDDKWVLKAKNEDGPSGRAAYGYGSNRPSYPREPLILESLVSLPARPLKHGRYDRYCLYCNEMGRACGTMPNRSMDYPY